MFERKISILWPSVELQEVISLLKVASAYVIIRIRILYPYWAPTGFGSKRPSSLRWENVLQNIFWYFCLLIRILHAVPGPQRPSIIWIRILHVDPDPRVTLPLSESGSTIPHHCHWLCLYYVYVQYTLSLFSSLCASPFSICILQSPFILLSLNFLSLFSLPVPSLFSLGLLLFSHFYPSHLTVHISPYPYWRCTCHFT